jgi:hypothetical protein
MNIESVVQVSWLIQNYGIDGVTDQLRTTNQYLYAETIAIQSGHTVTDTNISVNSETATGNAADFFNKYNRLYPGQTTQENIQALMNRYGVQTLHWGFNINLKLAAAK